MLNQQILAQHLCQYNNKTLEQKADFLSFYLMQ